MARASGGIVREEVTKEGFVDMARLREHLATYWFPYIVAIAKEVRELRATELARAEALEKALREAICVANNTATSGRNGWVITTSQRLRAEEFAASARRLLEPK